METNIFECCDKQIFYKRQQGYSPREILYYKQGIDPYEDELLSLVHIARVCQEKGMPFNEKQIRKMFCENYNLKYHGNKISYWFFVKKFCSKKRIIFKYEKTHPSKKITPLHDKKEKINPLTNDSKKFMQSTLKSKEVLRND